MKSHFYFGLILVLLAIFVIEDYATGTTEVPPCIFAKSRTSHCRNGFIMPQNLVNIFNNLSQSMQDRLVDGGFASLTFNQFASLPKVFFTLLSLNRLSELDISKLIAVIKANPEDVTLAVHMTSAVKSQYQKSDFLEKIRHINTSTTVQHVLASATSDIMSSLEHNAPLLSDIKQMPFLLHMPPRYVLQLNHSEVNKIFLYLSNQPYVIHQDMNPLEKRLWASIYFKTFSENEEKNQINWLLTGYTEEELTHISISPNNFNSDFSIIQARAVFEKVYTNEILEIYQYYEAIELLPKLTPSLLQRFPSTIQDDYKFFPLLSSVATAEQMMEYIIANCIERKKLGPVYNKWGERIKYLKKWIYVLPLSVLKQYSSYTKLSPFILNETQSDRLTNFQAYYLTMKGLVMNLSIPNSVMMYTENLLSALPTTQLVEHNMGSFNSEVLQHILAYLPDNNIPRMVSLLTKIIDSFDSDEVVYSILANKAVNTYFDIMSSRTMKQIATHILAKMRNLQNSHLKPKVQQLPPRILSVLLKEATHKKKWTWNKFINSSQPLSILANGLNCDHFRNMETTDFILFISHYNQQRILLRKAFPKNLQYCVLHKLMEYLQLKMELQGVDLDEGVINVLEPIEIEAVGGYVLLSLPFEAIEENKYNKFIFEAIGKLTIPELLLATDITKLKKVALLAVKQLFTPKFADYFKLGNLVWFVNPTMLSVNTASNLKLALEGQMLDRRICLNEKERNLWSSLLIQMFGAPEIWSRGNLHTLGDLLLVFSEDVFLRVPESSWVDTADTLQSSYYDLVEWSQYMPFYKVCMEALNEKEEKELYLISVKRLVHWMLLAAERQLRTVNKASSLSNKIYNNYHKGNSLILDSLSKHLDMKVKPYEPYDDYSDESITEEYSYSEEYSSTETETSSTTETEESSTTESEENSTTETEESSTTYETTIKYFKNTEEYLSTETEGASEFQTEESSTTVTKEVSTSTLTKIEHETKTEDSEIQIEEKPTTETEESSTTYQTTTEYYKYPEEDLSTETEEASEFQTEESLTTAPKEVTLSTLKKIEHETKTYADSGIQIEEKPKIEFEVMTTAEDFSTNKIILTTQTEKEPITEMNSVTEMEARLTTEFGNNTTAKEVSKAKVISIKTETETEQYPATETEEKVTTNLEEKLTNEEIPRTKTTLTTKTNKETNKETKTDFYARTEIEKVSTIEMRLTTKAGNTLLTGTMINSTSKLATTEKFNNEPNYLITMSIPSSGIFSNTKFINKDIMGDDEEVTQNITTNANIMKKVTDSTKHVNEIQTSDLNTNKTALKNENSKYSVSTDYFSVTTSSSAFSLQADSSTEKSTMISTSVNFTNTYNYENHTTEEEEQEKLTDGELVEESKNSILKSANKNLRSKRSIFINWSNITFSCNAIKMVGKISALSLSSNDIDNMHITEINECREVLSQLDLPEDEQKNIWGRLDEKDPIHLMGNLLKVSDPTNIVNLRMKLKEPWILETISAFSQHITDSYLITAVMNQIKFYNGFNAISIETLAALRGFICHLDIENITSLWHRFHHVVALLGRLHGCPVCLPKLAEIAVSPNGFGKIDEWEIEDMETMGNIVAGLNDTQWQDVLQSPNFLLSGLQPSAISCLSMSKLKVIPKDSFTFIPSLTLLALSEETLSQLSAEQRSTIQEVKDLKLKINIMPRKKKGILNGSYSGSSSTMHPVPFVLLFLMILVNVFLLSWSHFQAISL